MNKKLFVEAIAKFSLGVALVGALIFLPAGTLAFTNGWLLMAILFVPMFPTHRTNSNASIIVWHLRMLCVFTCANWTPRRV